MRVLKLALVVFALSLVHCTRDGETAKMNLSIPTRSLTHMLGSTTTGTVTPPLQTIIINVQIPGQPTIARQYEKPFPSSLDYSFEKIPSGASVLVQVLAVYAASNGGMQLKYGDQGAVISGSTDV